MKREHGHTTIDRELKPYELPVPKIYDPAKADQIWQVSYPHLVREAWVFRKTYHVRPRRLDPFVIKCVTIDMQNTFGLTSGELSLAPNSVPEINRAAELLYRNARVISEVQKSFDLHEMMRAIFSPFMFLDEHGDPVGLDAPQVVRNEDLRSGKFHINPEQSYLLFGDMEHVEWLRDYADHYTRQLEAKNEVHVVWTLHAQLGSVGHAEVSQIHQATQFVRALRYQQESDTAKGLEWLSERYSPDRNMIFKAHDGTPVGHISPESIENAINGDVLIIFGWAGSHCHWKYMQSIIQDYLPGNPSLAKKIYVVRDLCAPVPGFEAAFEAHLETYRSVGINVVNAATPMDEWPNMNPEIFTSLAL